MSIEKPSGESASPHGPIAHETPQADEQLIGESQDLEELGRGIRFQVEMLNGDLEPAFAVRVDGQVHAYFNRCSHVPIELDWQEGEFLHGSEMIVCATHGAAYDAKSGACLGGPCNGHGLEPVPVRETAGKIIAIKTLKSSAPS